MKFNQFTAFKITADHTDDIAVAIMYTPRVADVVCGQVDAGADLVVEFDGRVGYLFRYTKRTVPGDILKQRVEAVKQRLEQTEGRKPGKKELKDIKDDLRQTLLAQAFPKDTYVPVIRDGERLFIFSTSAGVLDRILSIMCQSMDIEPLVMGVSQELMHDLMLEGVGDLFPMGEYLLKSEEDQVSVDGDLSVDEIHRQLARGLIVKEVALSISNASFTLTRKEQIKRIKLDDIEGEAPSDWYLYGEQAAVIVDMVEAACKS